MKDTESLLDVLSRYAIIILLLEMKLTYDSNFERRRDPRGPNVMKKVYVHGIAEPQVLPFEEWEKLPSDIKLTRGECNQLYNILTYNLASPTASVKRLIAKLEKQI